MRTILLAILASMLALSGALASNSTAVVQDDTTGVLLANLTIGTGAKLTLNAGALTGNGAYLLSADGSPVAIGSNLTLANGTLVAAGGGGGGVDEAGNFIWTGSHSFETSIVTLGGFVVLTDPESWREQLAMTGNLVTAGISMTGVATDIFAGNGTFRTLGQILGGNATTYVRGDGSLAVLPSAGIAVGDSPTVTGNWLFNPGTLTSNATLPVEFRQTWNNGTATFRGVSINVTNTASAAASALFDVSLGGVSQFAINPTFITLKSGSLRLEAGASALTFVHPTVDGAKYTTISTSATSLNSEGTFGWSSSAATSNATVDAALRRDAADIIAQRRAGTAAAPVPQTYRVYNFYTDAGNYSRTALGYTANQSYLKTEAAGTGTLAPHIIEAPGIEARGNLTVNATGTVPAPANGTFTFEFDGTTGLVIRSRGTDGTLRNATITLAP